jgi:hypothetical protein
MIQIYIPFYEIVTTASGSIINRLKPAVIDQMHEMINYLDGIEDKVWVASDTMLKGKLQEAPYGVYLTTEDTILFKLRFNI